MCGRFTLGPSPEELKKRFKLKKLPLLNKSYNIAPSRSLPVIIRQSPNRIVMMKWGFVWDKKAKFGTINLRRDSFKEKPFFKRFLLHNRCLIPADGFYEWGILNLEGKEEKYPFYFYLNDRKLFGFAGVYNTLKDAEGKEQNYFAIITTEPNKKVKQVHNRMPAIMQEKFEDDWLDPENEKFEKLYKMLDPYPEEEMNHHPVSKRVNSPKNDSADLIDEFDLPTNFKETFK